MRHPKFKLAEMKLLLQDEGYDFGVRAKMDGRHPVAFPTTELVPDIEKAHLGCSLCGRTDSLYENVSVSGWIGVKGHVVSDEDKGLMVLPQSTNAKSSLDRDVDWDGGVDHEGYACSYCCGPGENLLELVLVVPPKPAGTERR